MFRAAELYADVDAQCGLFYCLLHAGLWQYAAEMLDFIVLCRGQGSGPGAGLLVRNLARVEVNLLQLRDEFQRLQEPPTNDAWMCVVAEVLREKQGALLELVPGIYIDEETSEAGVVSARTCMEEDNDSENFMLLAEQMAIALILYHATSRASVANQTLDDALATTHQNFYLYVDFVKQAVVSEIKSKASLPSAEHPVDEAMPYLDAPWT